MKPFRDAALSTPLFRQATGMRLQVQTPFILLLFFALWLTGAALGRLLLRPLSGVFPPGILSESLADTVSKIFLCGTQIILFFLWVRFAEGRPARSLGFSSSPLQYLSGVLIGMGMIILIAGGMAACGVVHFIPRWNLENGCGLILMIPGWMIQSAAEEISVRGWLLPKLGQKHPLAAILVTGLLFGLLHLLNNGVTLLSFCNLVLAGWIFALYAVYTGNLWGACGLHFAWNACLNNLFGFSVSGFSPVGGHLFEAQVAGSQLLTGGTFGPEGSVLCTLVLLTALLIFVRLCQRKFCAFYNSILYNKNER